LKEGSAQVPVEVLGFHHFTLLTQDVERAAVFYDGVLGLPRKERPAFSSRGIWHDVGDQELHVLESRDLPEHHEGHPAFEVADIRVAVTACLAGGATLQQDTFVRTHDGSLSAFVRDPDGNLLGFCSHGSGG
jgi:glyoxylase I family protein